MKYHNLNAEHILLTVSTSSVTMLLSTLYLIVADMLVLQGVTEVLNLLILPSPLVPLDPRKKRQRYCCFLYGHLTEGLSSTWPS